MDSLLIALLPLILTLGMIALIVIVIKKVFNSKLSFTFRNSFHWLLVGYLSVLLITTVIFYVLSNGKLVNVATVSEETIRENEQANDRLYQLTEDGNVENIDSSYIRGEWEFPFDGDKLVISDAVGVYMNFPVFVERKKENDATVEVTEYATKMIIENIDFTEKMSNHKFYLEDNTLQVIGPEYKEINVAKFYNEFPITQFTGEAGIHENSQETIRTNFIYVRVPKDVEIVGDVQVVGE